MLPTYGLSRDTHQRVQRATPPPESARSVTSSAAIPALDYSPSLLADPRLGGRGNGSTRAALLLQLQQTHGNRAARRLLQRSAAPAPLSVQRWEGEVHARCACAQNAAQEELAAPIQRQALVGATTEAVQRQRQKIDPDDRPFKKCVGEIQIKSGAIMYKEGSSHKTILANGTAPLQCNNKPSNAGDFYIWQAQKLQKKPSKHSGWVNWKYIEIPHGKHSFHAIEHWRLRRLKQCQGKGKNGKDLYRDHNKQCSVSGGITSLSDLLPKHAIPNNWVIRKPDPHKFERLSPYGTTGGSRIVLFGPPTQSRGGAVLGHLLPGDTFHFCAAHNESQKVYKLLKKVSKSYHKHHTLLDPHHRYYTYKPTPQLARWIEGNLIRQSKVIATGWVLRDIS